MSIDEVRNTLYCHMMDLEANHPGSWDYDIWQVKQALEAAVDYFDREMERYKNTSA